MGNGRIWLDRKILDWEWWDDINTFRLFTYCLLRANWKDGKFQGVDIPRGSFATSLANLASSTGLSVRQIRTAILHLKTTGELTIIRHSKFSVVVVNNYNYYQDLDTVEDIQVTDERHRSDIEATTIEESNKEINNINVQNFFEEIWKRYPFMKKGKGQVSMTQKKKLYKIGKDEMFRCLERFENDNRGKDPQYIMRGSTFFNSGYVDYLDENYQVNNVVEIKQGMLQPEGQLQRILQ